MPYTFSDLRDRFMQWLNETEVHNSTTLRLILFGQSQSGKSTLCAMLASLIRNNPSIMPVFDLSNKKGTAVLNTWVSSIEAGKFPDKTMLEHAVRAYLGFYINGSTTRLIVEFLEYPGELLDGLNPISDAHDKVPVDLREWCDSSDLCIVAAPVDPNAGEKRNLEMFLEWFLRVRQRPVCFVITKADKVHVDDLDKIVHQAFATPIKLIESARSAGLLCQVTLFSVGETDSDGRIKSVRYDRGASEVLSWLQENALERSR